MNMNSNLACRRLACLVAAFVCIAVGQTAADKPAASPPAPEAHVFGGPWSGSCNTTDAKENVIPLAGEWRFELDRKDVGIAERWFDKELSQTIRLPGTVSTSNLGDPLTGIRQQIWGGKFTDQPLWHPMIHSDYRGNAWYQTAVEVAAGWTGQSVELFLERVCWVSEAWIDGRSVGVIDTLSAPHRHVLGPLTPGQHRIALRIDNRPLHDLGCNTHAYQEQSCTIYNGVIGRVELRATPAVSVTSNQIYPDAASGVCDMRLTLANATGQPQAVRIAARVGVDGKSENRRDVRVRLAPLHRVHHQRFAVYWKVVAPERM